MYENEKFLPGLFNKSKIVYFDNNISQEIAKEKTKEFAEEYLF